MTIWCWRWGWRVGRRECGDDCACGAITLGVRESRSQGVRESGVGESGSWQLAAERQAYRADIRHGPANREAAQAAAPKVKGVGSQESGVGIVWVASRVRTKGDCMPELSNEKRMRLRN